MMLHTFLKDPFFFGEDILNSMHIFTGSWLDYLMIAVTSMGNQIFYVVMLPIAYWIFDKSITVKIGIIFLLSSVINDVTKEIFQNPRPDPARLLDGIRQLNIAHKPHGPGFPSGHTQGAVTFWGPVIYFIRRPWLTLFAAAMIVLIPYSRIYLAVHYLGDVLGGYVIGALCLLVFIPLVLYFEKRYRDLNGILIAVVLMVIPPVLVFSIPGWATYQPLGVLSGMLLGAWYAEERVEFNPVNSVGAAVIKIVIGLAGVFAIKAGLKFILPEGPMFGYIRYWLIGAWVSFAAPLIFSRSIYLRGVAGTSIEK